MLNRLNNIFLFVIVAAVFAMIGLEAANHISPTHSGTQQVIRYNTTSP
jgi:hypothetical protein